ncbi:laminin subunit gamma-2 [Protobothrops mucrosquamatus]|uniref:laminin subunit gamma-2 n=1 Tax=Protobothrops mucrosquamatus TaxID=103944 RepID=UPI0007757402|nr:laminin subunit gamma-2 [Protobothrops mucrosquamatus]
MSLPWLITLSCLSASLFPATLGTQRREACNCNGKSRHCIFDLELLRRQGNGYRCLNCIDNTDGINCERCKEGFYRRSQQDRCMPCNCNLRGSVSAQCDNHGRCHCKPGVTGDKCDRCQHNFHSFSEAGCIAVGQIQNSQCNCDPSGSTGQCVSGRCVCKTAVAGERCDRCKQGYYNLNARNPEGCSPCFCYGHSTTCSSGKNYSVYKITTTFQQGDEGWQAQENGSPLQLQWSPQHKEISVASRRQGSSYFVAPARFLGNQQLSYGQMLSFDYRVNRPGFRPSQHDVILEGAGLRVMTQFPSNGRMLPCGISKTYTYRLDEHPSSNWSPRLSNLEYHQLIGNLSSIRIRAAHGTVPGYLSNVILVSARPSTGSLAPWVEQCACPTGYQGQFCEKCASGYKRENSRNFGAFRQCVLCQCKGGGTCDSETGECYAGDETLDHISTACPTGFYSLPWDSKNCQPCPCQSGYGCSVLPGTQEVVCNRCPPGTGGSRCEFCTNGYFGNPLGGSGLVRPCQPCRCNTVDPNASGTCDRLTGECKCKDGFFGQTLSTNPAEKCQACNCNSVGSEPLQCRNDGSCICKPGFEGPSCEHTRCPICYHELKTQIDQYLQQLQGLEIFASRVQTSGQPADYIELERKMREAEELLQRILRDTEILQATGRALGNRFSKAKSQEFTYRSHLDEINEIASRMNSLRNQYQSQVQDVQRLIEKAYLDLDQSKAKIEGVIVPSPDATGSGSNRFLILANEAMKLANSHLQLADTIEEATRAAEDASQEALALLQAFASGEGIGTTSVQGLQKKYDELKLLTKELEADASQAASNAERVYQDSQQQFGSLTRLTKIDTKLFQEEAGQLQQKMDSLSGFIETYLVEYKQLKNNLGQWEEEIKLLLEKGQNDRQSLVQLLSRVNLAKQQAQQAVSAGDSAFNDVENILKKLRDLNIQVGDKQKEALDAMQRLPIIINKVVSTREKLRRVEAALGKAVNEAEAARRMSGEAREIAGNIDQEIGRLALEANRTADGVLVLESGIMSLKHEVKLVGEELQEKAKKIDMDASMAQGITEASQTARTKAVSTANAVQDILRFLEDVSRTIGQPEDVDEQSVNRLETDLGNARTRNNQLKQMMLQLEETASRQKLRVQMLDSSITEILVNIKNLEVIQDTLPPKCYNVQAIERP